MFSLGYKLFKLKMKYIKRFLFYLKSKKMHEEFSPSLLAIAISPTFIVRRGLYQAVQKFATQIEGDILDFGCGSRPYEHLFKKAKTYTGVDIKVSGHSHLNSKVDIFYDGKKLPFADNSFDCIVSFEVFEHVFNIEDIFSELSRVLKKDGYLLVTTPFIWEEHEVPYDFFRYSSFGICAIFSRGNFHVLELIKSTTHFLAIGQLIINYISQYLLPTTRYWGLVFRLFFIFPLNVFFLFLNNFLPDHRSLYCSNVVLARNNKNIL